MPVVTPPTCFSWNVHGFDAAARTRFWEWLKRLPIEVCFLQEHTRHVDLTHVCNRSTFLSLRPPVAGVWRPPCETETFLGDKTAVILVGDNWDIEHQHHTPHSSVVQARRRSDNTYWHFVSLYLPTKWKARRDFLADPKNLRNALQLDHVKPNVKVIAAGDINEVLSLLDIRRTTYGSNSLGSKLLEQITPMVDVFRHLHSGKREYSFHRRRKGSRKVNFTRRIDVIWSSAEVAETWTTVGYFPEIGASDHSILVATAADWKPDDSLLSQAKMQWWNFPRHLLKHPAVAQRVRQLFQLLHPSSTPAEFQRFFARLPALLESEKARHNHQRATEQALLAAHSHLRALVTSTTPVAVEDLAVATRRYEDLRVEIYPEERQSVSRTHRDAVQWASKQQRLPPPPILSATVQARVGHQVSQPAAPTSGVRNDQRQLLRTAEPLAATPGRSDAFTASEATQRLNRMSGTSAAGPSGLPTAILKAGGATVAAAAAATLNALSSLSATVVPALTVRLRGLLLCKWKSHLDVDDFDNYRLLAIADAEIRLLFAIVADRLRTWLVQGSLHGGQTAFLPGRNVAEGPLEMLIVASAVARGFYSGPATLLVQDQSKAFDRVDHGWLFMVLQAYGLSMMLIVLLQRMMANVTVSCLTSQGSTTAIPVRRGLPQGLATSPFLYIISLQPLLDAWRASGRGVRLTCNDAAADSTQHTTLTHGAYADNTFWWLENRGDFLYQRAQRKRYDNASGSSLNGEESFIVTLNGSADDIDREGDYRRHPKEKTFIYIGRPINMAAKSSLDLRIVRRRLARAYSLFRQHMSIFVKAQLMVSYGLGSLWHYIEFATCVEGGEREAETKEGGRNKAGRPKKRKAGRPKKSFDEHKASPGLPTELNQLSTWVRLGLLDGNGKRFHANIAFKPRHLGGLGIPNPIDAAEMRLLRDLLSILLSSSSSSSSSPRSPPNQSPFAATLQHHLTHFSRKELGTTWLRDVVSPSDTTGGARVVGSKKAWEAWEFRFLRALQRARLTLTRKPDWSTLTAAQVGEMPFWHAAYELEPIFWVKGRGNPASFYLTPPQAGAAPFVFNGKGFAALYHHGVMSFRDILFLCARAPMPSSTEPLLQLGVGPPAEADLVYWSSAFNTQPHLGLSMVIKRLQLVWPQLLARYPAELKAKLLELVQAGSPRDPIGSTPPPSAARPLCGSRCRGDFPWRVFDVAGVPAAEFTVARGMRVVADNTVDRPGVPSVSLSTAQNFGRTLSRDEDDAQEDATSAWREQVNYRRLWYDVKRYQLPGTSRDPWYFVCRTRCTMVRDEKHHVAACGSCPASKALSDHLYIECPATQAFWREAALLAWEVTGKRADEPPPTSDFAELLAGWPTWSRANCTDFPSRLRTRHVFVLAMQGLKDWFWSCRRARPQPLPVAHIMHCVRRDLQAVLLAYSSRADYDVNWRQGNLAFDFSDDDKRPQIATADVAPGPPDAIPLVNPQSPPVFTPAAGLGPLPQPVPLSRPQDWSLTRRRRCRCCRFKGTVEVSGYCARCFQPHTGQRVTTPQRYRGVFTEMCDRCGGKYRVGLGGQRASMATLQSAQPRTAKAAATSTSRKAATSTSRKAATSTAKKVATARQLSAYWSKMTPTVEEETSVEAAAAEEAWVDEAPVDEEEAPVEAATLAQDGTRASTLRPRGSTRPSYADWEPSASESSDAGSEYVEDSDAAAPTETDDDDDPAFSSEEDDTEASDASDAEGLSAVQRGKRRARSPASPQAPRKRKVSRNNDVVKGDDDAGAASDASEAEGLSAVQRGKRRARSPSPQGPRKAARDESDNETDDESEDETDDEEALDEPPFDELAEEMDAYLNPPPSPDLAAELYWW